MPKLQFRRQRHRLSGDLMAFTWQDAHGYNGTVVLALDPYNIAEWKDAVVSIAEPPKARVEPMRLLIDARSCKPPTADFVIRALTIIETASRGFHGGRIAVVADNNSTLGMGRLAEATTAIRQLPFSFRAFSDFTEAERWLSVAEPPRTTYRPDPLDRRAVFDGR